MNVFFWVLFIVANLGKSILFISMIVTNTVITYTLHSYTSNKKYKHIMNDTKKIPAYNNNIT